MSEQWLRRLCDATTSPPEDTDVDALLTAWASVVAARQALLDEADRPLRLVASPLTDELSAREEAWHRALAAARERVGSHRMQAAQARRYQHAALSADS
ncbi:MAG: hypothetical protein ABI678_11450 [Kofleriaceae bacterium]